MQFSAKLFLSRRACIAEQLKIDADGGTHMIDARAARVQHFNSAETLIYTIKPCDHVASFNHGMKCTALPATLVSANFLFTSGFASSSAIDCELKVMRESLSRGSNLIANGSRLPGWLQSRERRSQFCPRLSL